MDKCKCDQCGASGPQPFYHEHFKHLCDECCEKMDHADDDGSWDGINGTYD